MRTRIVLGFASSLLVLVPACPIPDAVGKKVVEAVAVDENGTPDPSIPPQVLNDHAIILDNDGKPEEALRFYDAALERYPEDDARGRSVCLFNKGLTLRRMGRWQESVDAYAAAYALEPKSGIAINISMPLYELGRVDEAVAYLDRELAEHPDDIRLVETKAAVLRDSERHSEARPIAEHALALRERAGGRDDQGHAAVWRAYLAEH